MKRLLLSTAIIGTVFSTAFLLSRAYFSDTQTSSNNLFTAGTIDLKIGNTSYYNRLFNEGTSWAPGDLNPGQTSFKFFNFNDLKPGDWGEDTISLRVDTNDAWACYDIQLTSNADNDCNDPELLDDPSCDPDSPNNQWEGELADNVNFAFWLDDGDNVYEAGEQMITQGTVAQAFTGLQGALADSQGGILQLNGQPMEGEKTYYIAKAWCFGEFDFSSVPQDNLGFTLAIGGNGPDIRHSGIVCNGEPLDNSTQTDSLTADISFSAIQARNNADYVCPGPISCQQTPAYAAATDQSNFLQGLRKNDTPVLDERSDPNKALGSPEGIVTPPSFVSLGFGGSIIVSFAGPVGNGAGGDLTIHEITNGRNSYPEELATVEVSQNGTTWFNIGTASSKDPNGTVVLDIDNGAPHLAWIQYVRLTDISNEDPFEPTADGYDLDAVEAIYGLCQ